MAPAPYEIESPSQLGALREQACLAVDPGAAKIAAYVARRDPHVRIVADALNFPSIGFGVEIEHLTRCRISREPHRRAHANSGLAKGFQADVLGGGKLGESIGHSCSL